MRYPQRKEALFFGVALALVFLAGCSQNEESSRSLSENLSSNPSILTYREAQAESLLITDEQNRPLRAKILIGSRWGTPFKNNFILTDAAGRAALPQDWIEPSSVTVDAPGYIRLTLMNQDPQAFHLQLQPIPKAQIELRGLSTGFPSKDFDQKVDFGLLLTGLRKSDVFTFTPDKVISPINDQLSVAGQSFELPSNVALPRQRETYLLPITIDKPQYRMFYTNQGKQNVFMARGQFPLKEVVDGFQNKKEIFELINLFSIQGGQLKEVQLNSPLIKENFDVNELTFSEKIVFKAPAFSQDQVLIVLSAAEISDSYLPADLKRFKSGETLPLNLFSQKKNVLLGILKNKNEFKGDSEGLDRFSAHLLGSLQSSMRFIPMADNPEVIDTQNFRFRPPLLPTGLHPLGMSVLISSVDSTPSKFASFDGRAQTPRWEVRTLSWSEKLTLPEWPETFSQVDVFAPSQKIQISFVATTRSLEAKSWNDVLQSATHVSHASKNY